MTDLIEFLRARLAEDEAAALGATDGPWTPWRGSPGLGIPGDVLAHAVMIPGDAVGSLPSIAATSWMDADHIARHDPARVLRQVAAVTEILRIHNTGDVLHPDVPHYGNPACVGCGFTPDEEYKTPTLDQCPTLRAVALMWSDHPDYQPEWAEETP